MQLVLVDSLHYFFNLNPCFTPNTVPTSIMIDHDHDVHAHNHAHNTAHNLAHNPFINQVATRIVPSKGELTSSFSSSTARTACGLDESTVVASNDPLRCYIKPPLYLGIPLKTAFGHMFGIYLFLCLIDAHGKTPWLGYYQESLASGHSDGSSTLVTITPPNVTSPKYLVNIVLHQNGRNGEHPHENHYSNNQLVKHLFNIICETNSWT